MRALPSLVVAVPAFLSTSCHQIAGSEYLVSPEKFKQCTYKVDAVGLQGRDAKLIARIVGKESISGKEYYKTVFLWDGLPGLEQETVFSRLGEDGLYAIEGTATSQAEHLSIPLPLEVGTRWEAPFKADGKVHV